MILRVENIKTINLKAKIDEEGKLFLSYIEQPLRERGDTIFDELPKDGRGPHDNAEVVISDFTHEEVLHQVFAWEVLRNGELLQWARSDNASRSGERDNTVANVLVVAISTPKPGDGESPPAPGSTQTTVKVKIKKQGAMPF